MSEQRPRVWLLLGRALQEAGQKAPSAGRSAREMSADSVIAETIDEVFWVNDVDLGNINLHQSGYADWGRAPEPLSRIQDPSPMQSTRRIGAMLPFRSPKTPEPFDLDTGLSPTVCQVIHDRGFPVEPAGKPPPK